MGFAGRYSGRYVSGYAGARYAPALRSSFLFDGGLHKPQRAVVQDACVLLLQRLLKLNGGYLEAVEATDSQVHSVDDGDEINDMIDQLGGRMPAVLIATGDGDIDTAGDVSRWQTDLEVHVYFLNNNARSRISRTVQDVVALADPTADPGVFVAMEHVRMLLAGQKPGGMTQLKELRPIRERRVGTDGERVVWEQIYRTKVSVQVDLKRDISLELTQINTYNRLAEQTASDEPLVSAETKVNQ